MNEMVFGNDNGLLKETYINKRQVICKSCSLEFSSIDVKCFEHNKEKVLVHCPRCKTENLILKKKVINSNE